MNKKILLVGFVITIVALGLYYQAANREPVVIPDKNVSVTDSGGIQYGAITIVGEELPKPNPFMGYLLALGMIIQFTGLIVSEETI